MRSETDCLPTIYPSLQYRDCVAAIAWLIGTLGFARHLVVSGRSGRIDHAELRFGNGLVMLSSAAEGGLDWLGMPLGAANISLVANDGAAVDALHDRVRASGARIVRELSDSDYGRYGVSHGFTCLDVEGNRWTVATYQPAARAAVSRGDWTRTFLTDLPKNMPSFAHEPPAAGADGQTVPP